MPNHNDILFIKSRHSLTDNELTKVQEYKPVIHPLRQFGLGLGSTHPTLTNITWETLDIRRSRFSLESRYLYRHTHSISLQSDLHHNLHRDIDAPLPPRPKVEISIFGTYFSLLNLRRKIPRPVSCYAFFKGWLLLSQPPGCFRNFTSLTHLSKI